ncbi:hypothetical protein psyc5s11_02650 [Clostridium gelidum]|uniref:Uncharacterized protein n=1 Tax=Clostridium gelidum TaxID=704125 RepID=A0ABM7SZ79_9CLOT|nr:hypothetical protein psyc5s11_02650 [Clostridium gelidum]
MDSPEITIYIDSTVENVEGNQEGSMKGYNPNKHCNKCYNVLMSFCSELKYFVTGFQRSGNTYASNGTAEIIKPATWSQERRKLTQK